jgi:hypothetical protein
VDETEPAGGAVDEDFIGHDFRIGGY